MRSGDFLATASRQAIEAPVGSRLLADDTEVITAQGWRQLVTPSDKKACLNEIEQSHVAPSDAERVVDETRATYRDLGVAFTWCAGPMSSPDALERRLEATADTSWTFSALTIDTSMEIEPVLGVEVERVDDSNVDVYLETSALCWDLDDAGKAREQHHRAALSDPSSSRIAYIGRVDGEPVGICGTVFKDDYGYLVAGAVRPQFRGRGLYRAMIAKRLRDIRARGLSNAISLARDATAAPILSRLGFETLWRARIYKFDA